MTTGDILTDEDGLRRDLSALAQTGPRKLASFALWIIDHFDEVAFLSIRNLTEAAGVDQNLAPRLAQALGYERYNDFRLHVQSIVQHRGKSYGTRARALIGRDGTGMYTEMIAAGQANFAAVTSAASIAEIDACVDLLTGARKIYTVGVRTCFSVAHYFSYIGSVAFESFVEVPTMPGGILDQMTRVEPGDVVVAITYDHYSAEVVRACQIARARGARIIALTDAESSPIALDAEKSIILPMSGPQLMPSLVSALLTVEMILSAMAAKSAQVADKIEAFEQRVAAFGGYLSAYPRLPDSG